MVKLKDKFCANVDQFVDSLGINSIGKDELERRAIAWLQDTTDWESVFYSEKECEEYINEILKQEFINYLQEEFKYLLTFTIGAR